MNRPRPRIVTRTVWLLSIVSLFNDISSEMLYPVLPVYLKSIGFSFFLIGLLEGLSEAVAGYSKGYFGHLSDTTGRRMPFVRVGYALSALAKGLLAVYASIVPVFIAKLSDRFGKGIRTSARDAVLARESTVHTRAQVFGLHRAMDTAGAALGPALALMYLYFNPGHYRELIAIAFIPGLLAVVTTFMVRDRKEKQNTSSGRPGFFSFFGYWKRADNGYRTVLACLTAFALVNSSDVFLLLAVKEKGLDDSQMIGAYIFYNLVFALLAWPVGRLADRLGMKKVIAFGLFAFFIVYAAVGFVSSFSAFIIVFTVYALFAACFESTARAFISTRCKPEESGTALGLYHSMTSLSAIVAGAWTGLVWMTLGAQWAFIISAAGALLVLVCLMSGTGRWPTAHKA